MSPTDIQRIGLADHQRPRRYFGGSATFAARCPNRVVVPLVWLVPPELVQDARAAGIGFRAMVADCAYGDNPGFTQALGAASVRFVLALKPRKGTWAPADQDRSLI